MTSRKSTSGIGLKVLEDWGGAGLLDLPDVFDQLDDVEFDAGCIALVVNACEDELCDTGRVSHKGITMALHALGRRYRGMRVEMRFDFVIPGRGRSRRARHLTAADPAAA
jgi:hypothetical protein